MKLGQAINRLVVAAESIAHTVALHDQDIRDSKMVNEILSIWDGWYNSREEGNMRPPEVVLDEIGEVLYRTNNITVVDDQPSEETENV